MAVMFTHIRIVSPLVLQLVMLNSNAFNTDPLCLGIKYTHTVNLTYCDHEKFHHTYIDCAYSKAMNTLWLCIEI